MIFLSSSRQTISVLSSIFLGLIPIVPVWGETVNHEGYNTTNQSVIESQSLSQFLLAQRGFRGFSGRYGAAPRRRSTPFRRGSCLPAEAEVTALFPTEEIITDPANSENLGKDRTWYTASAYPIIYIHVPENSAKKAEVVVEDSNHHIVYSAVVELPDSNLNGDQLHPQGFIGIDLSQNATALQTPALESSENYLWEVQLICDPIDRSGNPLVTGWITRIDDQENIELNEQISSENQSEKPWIYAENGIWYSALSALAHNYLDQSDPQGWMTLLEEVGYNRIAEDPILGMAEVEQVFIGTLPRIEFD